MLSSHELDPDVVSLSVQSSGLIQRSQMTDDIILNFKRESEDMDGQKGTRMSVFLNCEFKGSLSLPFDLFRDFVKHGIYFVSRD